MKKLGDLAASRGGLPIQSHLSENLNEIKWVKELHPDIETYTEVYKHYGLLTKKTVMAHCIHLSEKELDIFKDVGAGISHCACSNFSLESGVLNMRRLLDRELNVGLGTDVAGGYHPSLLDAMRQSLTASKVVASLAKERRAKAEEDGVAINQLPPLWKALTSAEVFYLATLGGARVMGLDDTVGNFTPGKDFDALLVDLKGHTNESVATKDVSGKPSNKTNIDVFDHDDVESLFEKFLVLGDDRNLTRIWVKGKALLEKS
jgi:guanine deaminase